MNRRNRNVFKLSDLSEEEVLEFMNSESTDEESDYDDDDSVADPNFDPCDHEISPEDDMLIDEHIEQVCSCFFFIFLLNSYSICSFSFFFYRSAIQQAC